MKKYLAEFIGTFTLVLFGCGTAVIAGSQVGFLGIAFAFGLALIAMAYGIGDISGCHINPAVSLGVFIAGRMKGKDLIGYIISQILGAIVASAVLLLLLKGNNANLGQNIYETSSQTSAIGNYGMMPSIVFELIATFIFVIVILGSTYERKSSQASTLLAGLSIGLTLTVIHIFGIPITGVSVNPARSFGPALLVGGEALKQVWLFLVFPSLGGILAGLLFKFKILEPKEDK